MKPVLRVAVRLALVLAVLATGLAAASTAQADRSFSLRYSANETGSLVGISNSNMTCPTSSNGCSSARDGVPPTSANSSLNNDNWDMTWVDVDGDNSTTNSSTSKLAVPAGSTIQYAALYWGGRDAGSNKNQVKFKLPGGSYQTVTASTVDTINGGNNSGIYQAFADVTGLVQALPNAGNGTYAVGNIQGSTGSKMMAGWSLIVVYKNASESMKNITIFDGLVAVDSSSSATINVNGFLTPPAGTINAKTGFITWEGDMGIVGDSAKLNGHTISDARHPGSNFFNSSVSHDGASDANRNPTYSNNLGFDAAWMSPPAGAIGNNATSAKIQVDTNGDAFVPGVMTFQVEILAPKIKQTKTVVDDNGGDLEQGDILTYTIKGKNEGDDGTANFVLRDPIPVNTTYVPGSIKIVKNAGAATGAQTDAAGDDRAEIDLSNYRVVARLGQGSNGTVGGDIAPGQEYEVTFKVKVNGTTPPVPNLTKIHNEATATFNSKIGGTPLTVDSDTDITVKSPDLKITKVRSGADFTVGGSSEYTLSVGNHGDAKTQGPVTVNDALPAGLTATAVNAPGWTCNTLPADHLSCTRSDALAAGQSWPDIVVTVAIDDSVADEVENTAAVSGGGDANLGDNTSSSTNPASRVADLALVKTASKHSVKIGDTFSYSLEVTNNGPSKATSVAISDEIPAGLSFVSADPGCTYEPVNGTVVCAIGTLNNGVSKTVNITVQVDGDAAGQITNHASTSAQQNDPDPSNNSDDETVDASGADLKVTKTLKSPSAPVKTGDTVVYEIKVENNGPSDATGVVLYDALPAGLTAVSANDAECDVSGGAVTCPIGDLANGATYTVEVTGKVKPGQDELVNKATATGNEDDPNPGDNEDEVTTPVTPQADLAIQKLASVAEIVPGEEFTYTFKVTNNGPDNVTGITVTDTLPAGLTYVDGAPGCNAVGQVVTCTINFLAAGGSGQTGISVKYTGNANSVANTAKVGSDVPDPNPDNNTSTIENPVVEANADVQIVKTVDNADPQAGDTITYTLTVKNNGPGVAKGVVATDQLPSGVTFVSADAPCTELNGKVTCPAGDLASGEEASFKIKVKVNTWTNPPVEGSHGLDVQKVETQIDLNPGEIKTIKAECPTGFFVSDGSVRIDHVDQGTGSWAAPQVLESRASDNRTWQGTVRNTASGRAQAKIFAVCIRETTSPDTTGHDLQVTAPVSTTVSLEPGSNQAVLECPAGTVAIQPGFIADSPGHLVYSQPEGNGWKFNYVTEADQSGDDVTFSIRCLNRQVAQANGHSNNLYLERIWAEAVIQPGQVHEVQLICPDGSKGIVGGWDADEGLIPLGNDPRPVTRAFKIYNPTGQPLKVRYSLLCLGDRTGDGQAPTQPRVIVNTAGVTSTTVDSDLTNNESSATITATPGSGAPGDDIPNGDGKPSVNNPTDNASHRPGVTLLRAKVKAGGVIIKIKSHGKARGIARLTSVKKVKVGGKRYRKGTVLAKARYSFGRASTKQVRLKLTGAGHKILKKRKARKARLSISGGTSNVVKVGRR